MLLDPEPPDMAPLLALAYAAGREQSRDADEIEGEVDRLRLCLQPSVVIDAPFTIIDPPEATQ